MTISIHALLAESDAGKRAQQSNNQISIHALLAESDQYIFYKKDRQSKFLSTLSLRRATVKGKPASPVIGISIHALLAESDINGLRHK